MTTESNNRTYRQFVERLGRVSPGGHRLRPAARRLRARQVRVPGGRRERCDALAGALDVGDEDREVGGRAGPAHVLEQRRGRRRGRGHVPGARAWWPGEEEDAAAACECEQREEGRGVMGIGRRWVVVAV